jgi:hypothetical protein
MPVRLNKNALQFAEQCVQAGKFVYDERDAWSEHQPDSTKENAFIAERGWHEYAKWHLGVDETMPEQTKRRYRFPYGDFSKVHRCGVLTAESRAGQYKYFDIENAAAHLHGMLETAQRPARAA